MEKWFFLLAVSNFVSASINVSGKSYGLATFYFGMGILMAINSIKK